MLCAVWVYLAVVTLAACSGGAPQALQSLPTAIPQDAAVSASGGLLRGEKFHATSVSINELECQKSPTEIQTEYSVSGTVTGPFPGTFTATGEWVEQPNGVGGTERDFTEGFSILSKRYNVHGAVQVQSFDKAKLTCNEFAAPWKDLKWYTYDSSGSSGLARVTIVNPNKFEQSFR
jgi:hypothetical protein